MANDKITVLVNAVGSSLISVGREVGLEVTLNKTEVTQGIKVNCVSVTSIVGIVGSGIRGTVSFMLDDSAFRAVVDTMSKAVTKPDTSDLMAMSVVSELSNMTCGRALIQSSLDGVYITPPQLISGSNIRNIQTQTEGVRCFTLPFTVQPSGTLYLILSFNAQ